MITVVRAYKTVDGMIFENREQAEKHDAKLSLDYYKKCFKAVEEEQRKEKRLLADGFYVRGEQREKLQSSVAERKRTINEMAKELYVKKILVK